MSHPAWVPRSKEEIARHIASDLPAGAVVNLGIGVPTLIPRFTSVNKDVVFHSENGLLGFTYLDGPPDPDVIDAGKNLVQFVPGSCILSHADSFALVRGGHLDLAILGSYEVSAEGDLANWSLGGEGLLDAVGGAMDIAVGAREVWVAMVHTTRSGEPKIVQKCRYPLTASGVVTRIYTDLAALQVTDQGMRVVWRVAGITDTELIDRTDAKLLFDWSDASVMTA